MCSVVAVSCYSSMCLGSATNSNLSAAFSLPERLMLAVQRAALQLPPRRTAKTVKMPPISRAEGGQLQAPVGRQSRITLRFWVIFGFPSIKTLSGVLSVPLSRCRIFIATSQRSYVFMTGMPVVVALLRSGARHSCHFRQDCRANPNLQALAVVLSRDPGARRS